MAVCVVAAPVGAWIASGQLRRGAASPVPRAWVIASMAVASGLVLAASTAVMIAYWGGPGLSRLFGLPG